MINCPACGKENEDSALECRRCRAPLREGIPEEAPAEEAAVSSNSFGEVCRRCEAYNEPGARRCTSCGLVLMPDKPGAPAEEPPLDKTPPDASRSLNDELSALAISAEDAAEAGLNTGNGASDQPPADRTPPEAFKPPHREEVRRPPPRAPPPPPPRSKGAEAAAGAALAGGAAAAAGIASSRRAPVADPPTSMRPPKAPAPPAEKPCAYCGASNPPAARFCFDCGTPFMKKPGPAEPPPRRPPPRIDPPPQTKTGSVKVSPSIEIDAELAGTAEPAPLSGAWPPEEAAPEGAVPAEDPLEDTPIEDATPPFQASLVVEKGSAAGTVFALGRMENSMGGPGTHLELGDDPFLAPHAATLLFAEDHLVVRDEGTSNGVFVKMRDSAPLQPGDLFIAGERLLRYEGPVELARNGEGDTPFLGAPRPQGTATVRVAEVLGGGKTGRTCHRAGPVITIGRSGCDMNFPADSLLAAKHAEIRLGDESATLVDLGQGPSGVLVRVRPQQTRSLQGGDVLQIGDQLFRVEFS
jgi:ribosomal protein L40E